jgi:phage repressor protein C with HTH and peptisase S24 domain
MIKIVKVTGNSLSPFFLPGDFVLIGLKPIFSRFIQPGDFIVFDHEGYGRLIKKVLDFDPRNDHYLVSGTQPMSLDSKQLGPISDQAVIGKVLLHIKNPSSHSAKNG